MIGCSRHGQYRNLSRSAVARVGREEISAAALRNAKRLIGDAEILLAAGRHATVVALAVLAIEEATKAEMVRLIVSAPTPELRKEAWRAFRNHEFKQSSVIGAVRRAIEARPGLVWALTTDPLIVCWPI